MKLRTVGEGGEGAAVSVDANGISGDADADVDVEYERRTWRRRIDAARRVLEGGEDL